LKRELIEYLRRLPTPRPIIFEVVSNKTECRAVL
jgi:hypothetical protein